MRRTLAGVIILLPLLVGANGGPEPSYPSLRDCPFEVDPNLVVGRFLGCVRLEVGQEFIRTGTWRDAEGDPARAEILAGPEGLQLINKPRISSYTLLWRPRRPMITAIVIRVTDEPLDAPPQSQTGTIIVQVVSNRSRLAPRGCGGQP
jgi:hypothetical protein